MSSACDPSTCTCGAPLPTDCPTTYVACCDFAKLYQNIANYQLTTSTNLSQLYETFIEANGFNGPGSPFTAQLETILKNKTDTRNQLIYDMCQLAAAKVKCEETVTGSSGSILSPTWWHKNVWGETVIQNLIYVISLIIVVYLCVKIVYGQISPSSSGKNVFDFLSPRIKGTGTGNLVPIVVTVIAFLVFSIIAINYTTRAKHETDEDVTAKRTQGVKVMSITSCVLVVLSVLFAAISSGKTGGPLGYISDFVNLITYGLFITIGLALAAYIPQIALIGILIQRFFYSITPGSWWSLAANVIGAIILIAMPWIITRAAGGAPATTHVAISMFSGFVAITAIHAIVTTIFATGTDITGDRGTWSLLLMPIYQALLSVAKSGSGDRIKAFFGKDTGGMLVRNSAVF